MAKQELCYRAYLMRLWCDDDESGWRASLENPSTGVRQHFASVTQMIETIAEQTKQHQKGENDGVSSRDSH